MVILLLRFCFQVVLVCSWLFLVYVFPRVLIGVPYHPLDSPDDYKDGEQSHEGVSPLHTSDQPEIRYDRNCRKVDHVVSSLSRRNCTNDSFPVEGESPHFRQQGLLDQKVDCYPVCNAENESDYPADWILVHGRIVLDQIDYKRM